MQSPRAARVLFPAPVAFLVVATLMVAYTAGYAWSAPNTDTADELMRAYEIRHAIAFPLEGPPLGNVLHLGPVWFYLTAVPLFISHSWLAAGLFIGFVCSLKFPLAYWCGARLVDADLGVLWAAAMFLPGWSSIEQLVFLNPNGVAMAMLLVLAIALPTLERPASARRCAVLGLALGFAIHAHPTSLPVFVLAPLVLRVRHRNRMPMKPALAAMAAGFALPFVSYVASQASNGFLDWSGASTYVADQISAANIVNMPAVIAAYFTGPATMAQYVAGWAAPAPMLLAATLAALAALSGAAFFAGPLVRLRLMQCLVALVLTASWIACARPTTPVQFTWALVPLVGGLTALGLWSVARRYPWSGPVVLAVVAAGFVVNVLITRGLAILVHEGEATLPSLIMDTKGELPHALYRDFWFPAHRHGDLGRALCNAGGPASLHGHLANIVDTDLGLDLLFECNDRSRVALAGSPAAMHHFGMTRPFWRALSAAPDCWIGSLGLARLAVPLVARASIAIADGSTYLPRRPSGRRVETVALTVDAPAERGVMLTNVLGRYEHFRMLSASANSVVVAPAAENDHSALYRTPPGAGASVSWSFRFEATQPDAVDVVSIGTRVGSERPAAGCLTP